MTAKALPTVVLLHGLARRRGSLAGLARFLRTAGFTTWSMTYPSRTATIAEAAAIVTKRIRTELGAAPLAAVTHSLGGILVRHMQDPALAWERVVMLAPPNAGSAVAAAFATNPLYRWFYGPAGLEVGAPEMWARWPAPRAPFGIIAGTRARAFGNPTSWVTRRMFDGPSDGTVTVAEAELAGAAAFTTVPASHTWIMNHALARRQIVAFLTEGRFAAQDASG